MTSESRSILALVLQHVEGVGRVASRKLLASFNSIDDLVACPLEQIIVRLKGIGGAAAIAAKLHDETYLAELTASAGAELKELDRRRIRLLSSGGTDWPEALSALPNRFAPSLLYTFGGLELLARKSVAFVSDKRLEDAHFDHVQRLAKRLLREGIPITIGLGSGVDVVLAKLAVDTGSQPGLGICVAGEGLARISTAVRPVVAQVERLGGVLVSSFEMGHGPFDHDYNERILVQAALSTAVVVCAPIPLDDGDGQDSPIGQLISWCHEQRKPVFSIGPGTGRSDVHPLLTEGDDEWVLAALN